MIFGILKVSGHSMQPALIEKDIVIVSSLFPIHMFNMVAFKHEGKTFIKRVTEIKDNTYRLVGDNINDSIDSRSFGDIEKHDIIGKVIYKI